MFFNKNVILAVAGLASLVAAMPAEATQAAPAAQQTSADFCDQFYGRERRDCLDSRQPQTIIVGGQPPYGGPPPPYGASPPYGPPQPYGPPPPGPPPPGPPGGYYPDRNVELERACRHEQKNEDRISRVCREYCSARNGAPYFPDLVASFCPRY